MLFENGFAFVPGVEVLPSVTWVWLYFPWVDPALMFENGFVFVPGAEVGMVVLPPQSVKGWQCVTWVWLSFSWVDVAHQEQVYPASMFENVFAFVPMQVVGEAVEATE